MSELLVPKSSNIHIYHREETKNLIPKDPLKKKSLRGWQDKALREIKTLRSRLIRINAPMGSGKSRLAMASVEEILLAHPKLRCVIVVPEKLISNSFETCAFNGLDDKQVMWCPENFSGKTINTQEKLIAFLQKEIYGDRVNPRVAIVNIPTWVMVCETLGIKNLPDLFLWVDEAHHCTYEEENPENNNRLGNTLKAMLQDTRHLIGLSTATFFRGDGQDILPPEELQKFHAIELEYPEYMAELEYLRGCDYSFHCYSNNPEKLLQSLLIPNKKRIIYLPKPKANNEAKDWAKAKWTQTKIILDIVADLNNCHHLDEETIQNGVLLELRHRETNEIVLRYINFVSEINRQKKQDYLSDGKTCLLDGIITMNLMIEGANWDAAEEGIVIGYRGSMREVTQIVGRLLRDYEGKAFVQMRQLLCLPNKKDTRENLEDYLRSLYSSFVLRELFAPKLTGVLRANFRGNLHKHRENFVNVTTTALAQSDLKPTVENCKELDEITYQICKSKEEVQIMKEMTSRGYGDDNIVYQAPEELRPHEATLHFLGKTLDAELLTRIRKNIKDSKLIVKLSYGRAVRCIINQKGVHKYGGLCHPHEYQTFRVRERAHILPEDPEAEYGDAWDDWMVYLNGSFDKSDGYRGTWQENFTQAVNDMGNPHRTKVNPKAWLRRQIEKRAEGKLSDDKWNTIQQSILGDQGKTLTINK